MRFFRILAGFMLLVAAASATELKIKVVDPQSVAVTGAQVEVFPGNSATPLAVQTTSADGLATFRGLDSMPYRVRILAAGFARQSADISASEAEPVTVETSPGAGH